jgi:hypothetical protein
MTNPVPAIVARGDAVLTRKGHCQLTPAATYRLMRANIGRLDAQAAGLKSTRKASARQ